MNVNYKVTSFGWAECKLEMENQTFIWHASYYCGDALGEFLTALVQLNPTISSDKVHKQTKAEWYQEPGFTEWNFEIMKGNNLTFIVTQYDDENKKTPPFDTTTLSCSYDVFVTSLVISLDALLKDIGLLDYQKMWGGVEFPTAQYLKLKHYVMQKGEISHVVKEMEEQ